jgi:oxygen-independent coproporphyrinogen-3 oxidase
MKEKTSSGKSVNPCSLFENRIRSSAQARRILPFNRLGKQDNEMFIDSFLKSPASSGDRVIYVHIPFCKSICPFCIYSKQKTEDVETMAAYCRTLINQIESVSSSVWSQSAPFKAIFFGGGTPTALPVNSLTEIIATLKKNYPLTAGCEITVESTISEINSGLCGQLKDSGVTRISLGVQSFDTGIRKNLGRTSATETILDSLNVVHESGFSNICIDLMYGLEGQCMETWQRDFQYLALSPVTGCSVYPLIKHTNSPEFGHPGNQEQEYDLFLQADELLVKKPGWKRFTPVQYGHSESGKAIYVSSHGQSADLLAFGAGAGGRFQNFMYLQSGSVNDFIREGNYLTQAPMTGMFIDPLYLKFRKIYALSEGLQIRKNDFEPLIADFGDLISELVSNGLADNDGDLIHLTRSGRFWAGNISALFSERIRLLLLENKR